MFWVQLNCAYQKFRITFVAIIFPQVILVLTSAAITLMAYECMCSDHLDFMT
jgi:hypothetical protein